MIKRTGRDARFATELVGAGGVETVGIEEPLGGLDDIVSLFHTLKVNRSFYFFKPIAVKYARRY